MDDKKEVIFYVFFTIFCLEERLMQFPFTRQENWLFQ